ncbi:MAG TPA: hypothetical protein VEL68_01785 [Thermodesulfobacteriota bacterium]|nr:hypothetical protein [Thermodesulfobacteriota bacterium]
MSSGIRETMEELLRASAEVKNKLAGALEEISQYGIANALKENPDFLYRLLIQLRKADASRVLVQVSKAADKFSDLLWQWIDTQSQQSQSMKSLLIKAQRDIHVNIEASDSPFQCHFMVKGGKITGGSGLLHFKDEDFRFMGPTETLMGLFIGDLPLGFSNLQLQTAGHSGWMSRVGPIMREISKLLKGS